MTRNASPPQGTYLMTAFEVVEAYPGLSKDEIDAAVAKGELGFVRIGEGGTRVHRRYTTALIDQWLASRTFDPAAPQRTVRDAVARARKRGA